MVIPAGDGEIAGDLIMPPSARGVVLIAHGSGSSRFSGRTRFVAERLQAAQLGTCLIDLLSQSEETIDERRGHLRFNIPLLAGRVVAATEWLLMHPSTVNLPVGCFGASTGAAAALMAAAHRPDAIGAVVSRGGRPDLAGEALSRVRCPTLLIVGGEDTIVLDLNRDALENLACTHRLEVIPGATHLFEEADALKQVADLAAQWFVQHLPVEEAKRERASRAADR
jgi:dienelactone hydrolase